LQKETSSTQKLPSVEFAPTAGNFHSICTMLDEAKAGGFTMFGDLSADHL